MPSVLNPDLLSPMPESIVRTTVNTTTTDLRGTFKREWQELIDLKLIEWGRNPEQFDDEEIDPPLLDVVSGAIQFAKKFQEIGLPSPGYVAPDGQGGIVFEVQNGDQSEVLHFWDDLSVEYQQFTGTTLNFRQVISESP